MAGVPFELARRQSDSFNDLAVAQKTGIPKWVALASGHMDQNLRNPSFFNFEPQPNLSGGSAEGLFLERYTRSSESSSQHHALLTPEADTMAVRAWGEKRERDPRLPKAWLSEVVPGGPSLLGSSVVKGKGETWRSLGANRGRYNIICPP